MYILDQSSKNSGEGLFSRGLPWFLGIGSTAGTSSIGGTACSRSVVGTSFRTCAVCWDNGTAEVCPEYKNAVDLNWSKLLRTLKAESRNQVNGIKFLKLYRKRRRKLGQLRGCMSSGVLIEIWVARVDYSGGVTYRRRPANP